MLFLADQGLSASDHGTGKNHHERDFPPRGEEEVAVASTAECFGMLDRVISLRVIVNEGEFN